MATKKKFTLLWKNDLLKKLQILIINYLFFYIKYSFIHTFNLS